jgi:hypothetical protein
MCTTHDVFGSVNVEPFAHSYVLRIHVLFPLRSVGRARTLCFVAGAARAAVPGPCHVGEALPCLVICYFFGARQPLPCVLADSSP